MTPHRRPYHVILAPYAHGGSSFSFFTLIIQTLSHLSGLIFFLYHICAIICCLTTNIFPVSEELPLDRLNLIAARQRSYVTSNKINAEGMKPETRKLLQELYGKFNEELARLLNDGRYTWQYTYTK